MSDHGTMIDLGVFMERNFYGGKFILQLDLEYRLITDNSSLNKLCVYIYILVTEV